MKRALFLAAGFCILLACNSKPAETPATDTTAKAKPAEPPQSEFADAKYTAIGKKQLEDFSAGNIDAYLADFTDNAMFRWSSGDSLAGKAAITSYWKERRGKVIDSISFANDIWVPLKVNRPQRGPDVPGVWLLGWYQVNVKYKNGKKLQFWVHHDLHFDNNDKIDISIQYIDRAPINKALGK